MDKIIFVVLLLYAYIAGIGIGATITYLIDSWKGED